MSKLVLYSYWRSSSAYRVRIALHLKGLAFETVPVNLLAGEQRKEAHVKRSPTAYVPCLECGEQRFVESVAIIEWLEETHKAPPLLPQDVAQRAHVRALVEVINSGIQPLQNLQVLQHLSEDTNVRAAWMRHFIDRGLHAYQKLVLEYTRVGPYSFGENVTMADLFLVPQIAAARRQNMDLSPFARLVAIDEALRALPAFQKAAPECQPDAVL